MPRIIKNTLLNYIPTNSVIEQIINPARIFEFNNKPIKSGKIIYMCEREIRAKDNFALQFALQKSKKLNLPLKIIHPKNNYEYNLKQKLSANSFLTISSSKNISLFISFTPDFIISRATL